MRLAFAKSLASMPDGGKLPPYPICKLKSLIKEEEKNISVDRNGKNHVNFHERRIIRREDRQDV